MPSRKSASIVPFQRHLSYRSRGWFGDVGKIKRERGGDGGRKEGESSRVRKTDTQVTYRCWREFSSSRGTRRAAWRRRCCLEAPEQLGCRRRTRSKGWRGKWVMVGAHTALAALSLQAGAQSGVAHALVGCQARGCLHSYIGAPGMSLAEDTTPGDDAGSRCPSCGCNIRGCGLGCSYFANIPRMEEISDRCS